MKSKSDFNIHVFIYPLNVTSGNSYTAILCINEQIPVIILQEV